MKKYVQITVFSLLASALVSCSSGGSSDPLNGNTTISDDETTVGNTGSNTGSTTVVPTGNTTAASTTGDGTTTANTTGDSSTTGSSTDGTTGSATSSGDTGSTTADSTTGDTGSTTGDASTAGTTGDSSATASPPPLLDPFAPPIPGPNPEDPFGSLLEVDNEAAVAGGPPTTPKNLRVDLVSNDWAEINWAPSNDDGEVVEYRIYRSDGHMYTVREDQTDMASGSQDEIDKFWRTTSFIDCNYTRFLDRLHICAENGPAAGDTFSYQLSAVDDEGNESPRSDFITITYHKESNSPVPKYDDFYKDPDDSFAQDHNLSETRFFLDKFTQVFEDEFDGTEIDSNKWKTALTWEDSRIINGEQQYFVDTQKRPDFGYDPFNLTGDSLIIEAIKIPDELRESLPPVCDEEDPFGLDRCEFLSGALSSHDKFGMTYGYVESRMKVGGTPGMLSSFYLYHRYTGQGVLRHAPEIDIVEYLGENPFGDEDAFQTYHFADVNDGSIRSAPTMQYKNPTGVKYSEGFHTFSVLWEPQLVIWYIDGKEVKRLTGPQVGRQQMNIVTYLVSGSAWAPTPSSDDSIYPLQYEIDYIRAYQRDAYNGNGLYPAQ